MIRTSFVSVLVASLVIVSGCAGGQSTGEGGNDQANCVELWNSEAGEDDLQVLSTMAQMGQTADVLVQPYEGPTVNNAAVGSANDPSLEGVSVVQGDCLIAVAGGSLSMYARTSSGWVQSSRSPGVEFDAINNAVQSGETNATVGSDGKLTETGAD